MGVHGLWRLIEASGKPVALETLENKVLAVDVSIWLHQAVKGFQDSKGAPVPNAHLLGIYHRVCKLLYFKIKPIFIFDGGVPVLKKQTIAKRNQQKSRNVSEAEKLQRQLLSTLLKHSAISKVLSEKTKASLALPQKRSSKNENMYALPVSELDSTISSSEEEEDQESNTDSVDSSSPSKHWDLHTIDMSSSHFKSLPVDVRHEILTELKETRKQSSWGRLHELPKQSDDFSVYQMNRLLKRQAVQCALEDAEKEMGGHSLSLAELESILKDHGVAITNDVGKRIASDENTKYLYIKDVKQALEKARNEQHKLEVNQEENSKNSKDTGNKTKADLEFEEDLEAAIALSLRDEPSTSKSVVSSNNDGKNKVPFSFLDNFEDGDFESGDDDIVEEIIVKKKMSSAQSYMMEYSGLTPNEINKILNTKKNSPTENLKAKKVIQHIVKSNEPESAVSSTRNDFLHKSENAKFHILETSFESNDEKKIMPNQEENNSSSEIDFFDQVSEVTTSEIVNTGNVELVSDSDSSNCDDFEEVSTETSSKDKNSMQIVIDTNEALEDDLFSDIFNKDEKNPIISEILNKPQSKSNTDFLPKESIMEKDRQDENSLEIERIVEKSTTQSNSMKENNEDALEIEKSVEILQDCNDSSVTLRKEHLESESRVEATNIDQVGEFKKPSAVEFQNLNVEQMTKLKSDLQREKIDILVEKSTKERMASNITDQMYQEAQDLLELFGVPYIIAPMEAEAQCAFLDAIELTDGTITDDSDIWLFGGRTVYKNFFNQSKYVMEFKVENIKHHFKLTREQMILLALLVGSDYTIGLQGVGPVTALEILAAFPPTDSKEFNLSHSHVELLSGLKEFRSWFNKGKSGGPGRSGLKNKLKNMSFTDNFPSLQVVQAYLEPTVETSKEKFSWSKPDFVGLTDLAKEKFGWSSKKTEEILKPVIKKVDEQQSQKSIKDYFKIKTKTTNTTEVLNQMSKRVKTAINRIGKTPQELIAEEMEALSAEKQKISRKKKISESHSSESKAKQKNEEIKNNPKRVRKKTTEETSDSSKNFTNPDPSKAKKSRNLARNRTDRISYRIRPNDSLDQAGSIDENTEELKKYKDIAIELKMRRQRRSELPKKEPTVPKNKKPLPTKTDCLEVIPEHLEDDEIELLKATTSRSLKRAEEIDQEVKNVLEQEVKKRCLPTFHKKEVIHQKLRDKSDVLKNKMRAIEIFRKSKKGPGYIPKREKKKVQPKEDAELSENSSDD